MSTPMVPLVVTEKERTAASLEEFANRTDVSDADKAYFFSAVRQLVSTHIRLVRRRLVRAGSTGPHIPESVAEMADAVSEPEEEASCPQS
jgi:hypothetical protein